MPGVIQVVNGRTVLQMGENGIAVRADRLAAEASADRAETEKLGSESARDAAVAYLNPHASQAAGEAATSEGEPFSFLDGDDQVALAVRTAGGSELLPTYFGAAKVGVVGGGTVQDFLTTDYVSIESFSGTDTQKLAMAEAWLPAAGGVIRLGRGEFRPDPYTFTKSVRITGHGFSATPSSTAATQIIKDAAASGPLFTFTVDNSGMWNLGFKGEAGNTGDMVAVWAGRFRARDCSIHSAGQDNIRFGRDGIATNTNNMSLINVLCHNAGRHNFHFHDGNPYASAVNPSTGQEDGANCNTGVLIGCEATGAGGDNFYFYQSWWMTGIGCVGQKATGAGLKIVAINGDEGSRNHYFAGGDFNESNAGGNIVCSGFECVFNNVADGGDYTDTGTKNVRYAPVGTRVQDLTVRNILTSERPTAGPVDYTMIAKSYGNVANGRGAGVEMQVPNGSGAARVGGRVSARQETTNRDAIYLSVNNSGTVQDVVYASPLLNGFCPVTTNAFNLGHSTKEWNTIFLSSSGNGLRVNNVKVIGARGAALPADATDLASVIALANAIKARMKATGGHGLVDD